MQSSTHALERRPQEPLIRRWVPIRFGTSRLLGAAFAFIFVLFTVASALAIVHGRVIGNAARDITTDATPSIERLAAARVELHRLLVLLEREVGDLDEGRDVDVSELRASRIAFAREFDAYRLFRPFPGEAQLVAATEAHLGELDRALADFDRTLRVADMTSARVSSRRALASAESVSDTVLRLIDLNASQARTFGVRIEHARQEIILQVLLLDGIAIALGITAARFAIRAVRVRETELGRLRREAEERANELEQFAARVAHDVQSPLAAVALDLDVLATRAREPSAVEQAAARGRRAVGRVSGVVESLLAFARSGARPVAGARADVREAVRAVRDEIEKEASVAAVSIVDDVPPGLVVACDPSLLAVVLTNLLRNAVKYMRDSMERVVKVYARANGRMIRIEVEDTGPGVPERSRRSIFDAYVRGDGERSPGIGLGLATVKRICEAHGGSVTVMPRDGGGSVFVVELRACQRAATSAEAATPAP
jgi:signal transduction histidine kinase